MREGVEAWHGWGTRGLVGLIKGWSQGAGE